MAERTPLPPINFAALADALLARADQLLPAWLPGGVKRGHEYVCGSVFGGAGSSCSVNMVNGLWSDFQSGESGKDLISLYAAGKSLSMGAAAVAVAREEGLEDVAGVQPAQGTAPVRAPQPAPAAKPAAPPRPDEGWATVTPVPDNAPPPTFKHQYRLAGDIEHTAVYSIDGKLYGYVVRFRTSGGGKETLPYTWCTSARDGASKWHWRTWDEPRPLYFPGGVSPNGSVTVVLVEGEKKASILQALLDAVAPGVYMVASWPGGCNGWKRANWVWLAGATVLLWPDCDAHRVALTKKEREACLDDVALAVAKGNKPLLPADKQPGMAAMLGIGAVLRDAHGCQVSMLPIPEPLTVVEGWDCADAITTDGWDGPRVLAFLGQAQALVAEPAAATAAKKIEGLGGPGAADFGPDDDGMTLAGGRLVPNWLACYWNESKKYWMTSRKMVITVLQHDPVLQPVLAFNELSNNIQSRVAWPWPFAKQGDVTDAVDLLLGNYLTEKYGLPSIPRAALTEAIQTVAHMRRFHPIREYLTGLKWDGKDRIDKWLIYALGESPDTLPAVMVEYLQIVGRCWLLGMVNRVMEPGCKFDYCPVLEGVGGLRKSTLVEVLASSAFYSDTPFDVSHGKEAQEQVAGIWLYELSELAHFNKAEVGAIKAFISSKVDRYRVAYGQTVGSFPRQCMLVGTTNENTYLRDRTGNRRFWPLPVRNVINTDWVAKYRHQLFAQAYALYLQGTPYTPTPDQERRLFVPMQESRLQETAVISELLHVLTRSPTATAIGSVVNELTSFVTIAQLTLALGVDAAKSSPALESQIRGWLDHEGWQRVKRQINGARAWGYERPAVWPKDDAATEMMPPSLSGDAGPAAVQDGDDVPF